MDDFIQIDIQQQIYKCFAVYGIEGTLETIERVYSNMPTCRMKFLDEYYKIINEVK